MFLILVLAIAGASASELNDFTNNLASDLGPLLALFGEEMTKQYLSESTKFVDYIIFAMAPVGIIIALVSVICVCGGSSLRAFIGKAQEADGAIEAELCTSTSRDVCELFNKAGITRVLGRPRLLELVFYPGQAKNSNPRMGIHIFYQHLTESSGEWYDKKTRTDIEASGKTKNSEHDKKLPTTTATSGPTQNANSSVRKPKFKSDKAMANSNLSLNVGIVKRAPWVFHAVATIGVTLQFGVMAMAGLATWKAGWTVDGDLAAFAHNKSPLIFIVGTAAMCGGMFLCAYLIGESTQEKTYYRKHPDPVDAKPQSRLFWLQPGEQVLGDE